MSLQKVKAVKGKAISDLANVEACTLNIAAACNYEPATTVLCHFPSDIAASKSTHLSAGFGCSNCHDVIDRRNMNHRLSEADREFYMRRSQTRTWHRLIELGVIKIKGLNW